MHIYQLSLTRLEALRTPPWPFVCVHKTVIMRALLYSSAIIISQKNPHMRINLCSIEGFCAYGKVMKLRLKLNDVSCGINIA